MEHLKNLLSFGNTKIPKTTAIFNMGEAFNCPSEKLGLCEVAHICYAKKAEHQYPVVGPYRKRQMDYWLRSSPVKFMKQFVEATQRKKATINALRLNESGDFWSQECVEKVDEIASYLNPFDVKVYTYTARKDLEFSNVSKAFINGSGFCKTGINNVFKAVDQYSGKNIKCKGDCTYCKVCFTDLNNRIIEVRKH